MKHSTFKQGPFEFATMTDEGHIAYTVEERGHPTPCFVWQRCRSTTGGYGLYGNLGRSPLRPAHRVAYEATYGPIPDGLVMDHRCRVRECVNPEHLEAVTQARNIRRSIATKLTDRKATEIRRLYLETDATMDTLAKRFGVTDGAIRKVLDGETWRGIDDYHRGGRSKRVKVTTDQVTEIRALRAKGHTQADIAARFGITRSYVSMLTCGVRR